VREPESAALGRFLHAFSARVSCGLARVEVPRAVAASGGAATDRARAVLADLQLVRLDDALLDAAAALVATGLRSLDAIHVAAARELGDELEYVVTYDRRMAVAASEVGMTVAAPT
jgi:predicted nucleic acid-binding protein